MLPAGHRRRRVRAIRCGGIGSSFNFGRRKSVPRAQWRGTTLKTDKNVAMTTPHSTVRVTKGTIFPVPRWYRFQWQLWCYSCGAHTQANIRQEQSTIGEEWLFGDGGGLHCARLLGQAFSKKPENCLPPSKMPTKLAAKEANIRRLSPSFPVVEEAHVCSQLLWFLCMCCSRTHIPHSSQLQYPWLVPQHGRTHTYCRDSSVAEEKTMRRTVMYLLWSCSHPNRHPRGVPPAQSAHSATIWPSRQPEHPSMESVVDKVLMCSPANHSKMVSNVGLISIPQWETSRELCMLCKN